MSTDPTYDPVATTEPGRGFGVSGWATLLTGGTGLAAVVQSFPLNGFVAASGVFASMTIQVTKLFTDAEKRSLRDRLNFALLSAKAADEREARHLARIADLVRQVDAANARADRMLAVSLEHAGEMGSDLHKTLADASKPAPPVGGDVTLTAIIEPDAPGGIS